MSAFRLFSVACPGIRILIFRMCRLIDEDTDAADEMEAGTPLPGPQEYPVLKDQYGVE